MQPDNWHLYRLMLKSRLFELAIMQLWEEGQISGEMHMGIGEEAIVAGVVSQLHDGDAMALDHRGTPPLLMRGINPVLIVRELLGRPDGLCGGKGGHMHLFSPHHLSASSGIVGASGPAAAGFALAAQHLRPGTLAVAFFGEGALNQGMMMEAMNLAVAWNLPVLFVCKDNEWAITTLSDATTGGRLVDRAHGFGMTAVELDGSDVEVVWVAAHEAIDRARHGGGPTFLHAHCTHPEGHLLGDPLLRIARHPLSEVKEMAGPQVKSFTSLKGASLKDRLESVRAITSLIGRTFKEQASKRHDPLEITRQKLKSEAERRQALEVEVTQEVEQIIHAALLPG